MNIVFCPNPACVRGTLWTGAGRPSRPVGKCPDCGRTSRLARPEISDDRGAAAEASYRRFSADCYAAAWSGSRR